MSHGRLLQLSPNTLFCDFVAEASTVPALVDGLVKLFRKQADQNVQPQATWQAHLLSKTLCTHPEAPFQLLDCMQPLFLADPMQLLWDHLNPFFSFSLLDHGPRGKWAS